MKKNQEIYFLPLLPCKNPTPQYAPPPLFHHHTHIYPILFVKMYYNKCNKLTVKSLSVFFSKHFFIPVIKYKNIPVPFSFNLWIVNVRVKSKYPH